MKYMPIKRYPLESSDNPIQEDFLIETNTSSLLSGIFHKSEMPLFGCLKKELRERKEDNDREQEHP